MTQSSLDALADWETADDPAATTSASHTAAPGQAAVLEELERLRISVGRLKGSRRYVRDAEKRRAAAAERGWLGYTEVWEDQVRNARGCVERARDQRGALCSFCVDLHCRDRGGGIRRRLTLASNC
jgi:hypothetical protein